MARYPLSELRAFAAAVFESFGVPGVDAEVAAARVLDADVRGVSTHGIARLPSYARRFDCGGYNVRPRIAVVTETPATALVDGDNGLGQLVMTRAAEVAIAKASEHGLAWVGVRRSNHAGAGSVYAAMASDRGLVGLYLAVGNANHMAPWGGVDPLMSTNPIAIAVPARNEPDLVIDIATSAVSFGKVKQQVAAGLPLPSDWMVSRSGQPVTDPGDVHAGLLLPMAGHKGYGLALAIAALAGTLNGASSGSATIDFNEDFATPTNTGHALLVLDPACLGDRDTLLDVMDERLREIRTSTPVDPRRPVRTPGSRIPQRRAAALAEGIEVPDTLADQLRDLGRQRDVVQPFDVEGSP
jgi:LDH2 family malate/lactate/ureidoglycolate dehydrogenase